MAKLYFRYGAMNCGKSSLLIQVAHNYNEKGKRVVVVKPKIDTKRDNMVSSRVGVERKVDILIDENESFVNYFSSWKDISCILVDESQFLKEKQVDELWYASKKLNIPVVCYGLRQDFTSHLFEGSKRLMELADDIEELVTICSCGKKAKFNARYVDGEFTLDGNSILIDGEYKNVTYESMCGSCYLKNSQKVKKLKKNIDTK